jgi:hypothetical protein
MDYQSEQLNSGLGAQQPLPNATAVLILGIISIVGCFCFGGLGLISGIIALILANKDLRLYRANPAAYTPASYSNLNSGRICAIIGLCISLLSTIYILIMIIKFGMGIFTNPSEFMNHYDV